MTGKQRSTGWSAVARGWIGRRRRQRFAVAAVLLAGAVALLPSGAMSADDEVDPVGDTRATLEKWVETRRVISKERTEWAMAREMLRDRIDIVKSEIESLRDKITEAEENITEADEKRAELVSQNERHKEASAALSETVVEFEQQTKKLLSRLPDPIRERVKPLSQRLPDDQEQTKLSLSERFQNIVGILNEINKFNREITPTSEVRALPDGTSAEVAAIYVGLGQAYYVGANNEVAGVGTATADGWVWTPANDAALQIREAIEILKNEQPASFVKLPIEIK
jgi:septal ring factor EnvC (AmiA/AmiB activator)